MSVIKQGSTGPDAISLQTRLKALGFSPGAIDGNFGPSTTSALMAFQKSKGLIVDGIAGPKTLIAIQNSNSANRGDNGVSPSTTPGRGMPTLLKESDFDNAASLINCDVAAIKAVAEVESAGNGFLSDGRVKVTAGRLPVGCGVI